MSSPILTFGIVNLYRIIQEKFKRKKSPAEKAAPIAYIMISKFLTNEEIKNLRASCWKTREVEPLDKNMRLSLSGSDITDADLVKLYNQPYTYLDLSDCNNLTYIGIKNLVMNLPSLKYLDISSKRLLVSCLATSIRSTKHFTVVPNDYIKILPIIRPGLQVETTSKAIREPKDPSPPPTLGQIFRDF